MVQSARLFFYDTLTRAWERAVAQKPFTLEDKADLMLATTWAVRSAARATDLMHRMGGTNGIYTRSRLERHVRTDSATSWLRVGQPVWKRSARCTWESRRNFHSWRSDARAPGVVVPSAIADVEVASGSGVV